MKKSLRVGSDRRHSDGRHPDAGVLRLRRRLRLLVRRRANAQPDGRQLLRQHQGRVAADHQGLRGQEHRHQGQPRRRVVDRRSTTSSRRKIQAGKQPDILNIDAFAGFASDDLLYPAKDIVSAKTLDDFQPSFRRTRASTAPSGAFPSSPPPAPCSTTRTSSQKAGITAPPTTWADLEADAAKLKAAGSHRRTACRSEAKRRRPRPRSGSTEQAAATATPRR